METLPPPPEVINDGRDPGDEHHDRPTTTERKRKWTVPDTDSANGTAKEDE